MEGELPAYSARGFESDLDALRGELLVPMGVGLLALFWCGYVILAPGGLLAGTLGEAPGGADAAIALLTAGVGVSMLVRQRNSRLARWVFVASSMAAGILVGPYLTGVPALGLLVLTIVIAGSLLGSWQAVLVTATLAIGEAVAWVLGLGLVLPARDLAYMLGIAVLLCVTIWLSSRPTQTAIAWALGGWTRARDMLLETRQRRAELYRVVHALEEATYRIERMNNELLLARQEAELARENKARFVATVSHELRGPLNLILGFSRLMALSPERYACPLPAAYRADVDTVFSNSQHLVDLLDDILDLSQIEVEHLPLVKDRVDLERDVVTETANLVRPLTERKGLYFHVEPHGNLPPIMADRVRLRQVLMNLLTNAIRFTDQGGVTVRTGLRDDGILISVHDTGRGIPSEQMSRLFQEFFRPHAEKDATVKGTGLGLAISKYLVQLHGGHIWAESTEGAGTAFYFTLPLPGAEPIAWSTVRTRPSEYASLPYEICLVVDDDVEAVRLLARHIDGYRVVGLPNENEVLAMVEELHPRAIITTPQRGPTVNRQLAGSCYDVPVLSCQLTHPAGHKRVEGVLTHLVKPIAPEVLHAALRQLDASRRAEGSPTTVLLVDDDPDAVRLLDIMLNATPQSYAVLKAYDGSQALDIMKKVVPDVVLMDLVMPGMDGQETVLRMHADPRLRDVPVVIVSARDVMEEGTMLQMPLTVHYRGAVEIGRGLKCVKALLDTLMPRYLPEIGPG